MRLKYDNGACTLVALWGRTGSEGRRMGRASASVQRGVGFDALSFRHGQVGVW
ncbi:hypothetical protein LJC45_04060 [Alistipes sp. OttesenSCG-928-B03]|nr:hypothetical protein [Alistipes sp. OttesenSCG-928-B03]